MIEEMENSSSHALDGEFVKLVPLLAKDAVRCFQAFEKDPYLQQCAIIQGEELQKDFEQRLSSELPLLLFSIHHEGQNIGLCGYSHHFGDRAFVQSEVELEHDAHAESFALMAKHYFNHQGSQEPWFTIMLRSEVSEDFIETIQDYGFDDFSEDADYDPKLCRPFMIGRATFEAYYCDDDEAAAD